MEHIFRIQIIVSTVSKALVGLGYKMKSTLETERESLFETLTFCESAFVQSVAKEIRIDKLDAGFSG